jgi:hypothetical protein
MLAARRSWIGFFAYFTMVGSACAPKAAGLRGAPVPARFPTTELAPGHRRIVFQWSFTDGEMSGKGEGLARIASPDSVRLDFFLSGGMGSGTAILIGDRLDTPGGDMVKRYIPPVPMLWASLGRLVAPPSADTVARVDGDTLRADIGRNPRWRVAFVGDRLVRMERISDNRVREWIARSPNDGVTYVNPAAHRSLKLSITSNEPAAEFDSEIWRR